MKANHSFILTLDADKLGQAVMAHVQVIAELWVLQSMDCGQLQSGELGQKHFQIIGSIALSSFLFRETYKAILDRCKLPSRHEMVVHLRRRVFWPEEPSGQQLASFHRHRS